MDLTAIFTHSVLFCRNDLVRLVGLMILASEILHQNYFQSDFTHKMLGPEFSAQLEQLRLAALQAFPQPCVQPLLTPDGFQGTSSKEKL